MRLIDVDAIKEKSYYSDDGYLVVDVSDIDDAPTIAPDTDTITQKALEAGKRGEEVKFYIGGRKFAVRELAQ